MMQKMRSSHVNAPSTLDEVPNPIFHQELGEGPVSAQPTEFTQTNDSQMLFMSNPDLKNILGDRSSPSVRGALPYYASGANNVGSDNKTAKLLDRSPQPENDKARIAASIAISNNREDDEDKSSSLGPMKLEFLNDDGPSNQKQKPQERVSLKDNVTAAMIDSIESKEKVSRALKIEEIANVGLQSVTGVLAGENSANISAIQDSSGRNSKVAQIKPIMSLFQSDKVLDAQKFNDKINDKIAKIRAMQEQILRPPRDSKSKSSVRSGR